MPEGALRQYLTSAASLIDELEAAHPVPLGLPETTGDFEHLRWFPYPDEALT